MKALYGDKPEDNKYEKADVSSLKHANEFSILIQYKMQEKMAIYKERIVYWKSSKRYKIALQNLFSRERKFL